MKTKCGYKSGNRCFMKNKTYSVHDCDGLDSCRYDNNKPCEHDFKPSFPSFEQCTICGKVRSAPAEPTPTDNKTSPCPFCKYMECQECGDTYADAFKGMQSQLDEAVKLLKQTQSVMNPYCHREKIVYTFEQVKAFLSKQPNQDIKGE